MRERRKAGHHEIGNLNFHVGPWRLLSVCPAGGHCAARPMTAPCWMLGAGLLAAARPMACDRLRLEVASSPRIRCKGMDDVLYDSDKERRVASDAAMEEGCIACGTGVVA